MGKDKIIKMDVDKLIALCHILDDYPEFNNKLINFLNYENNSTKRINKVDKLNLISNNKKGLYNKEIKQFYESNKKVIDIINTYGGIRNYISWNITKQDIHGTNYMYEYLLRNRDKLEQILLNLNKIKELGFNDILFKENIDFSEKVYRFYKDEYAYYERNIVYVENLECIPGYRSDYIVYKTNNSVFKIECVLDVNKLIGLKPRTRIITLNDLTFDVKRLPEEISKEVILNKFYEAFNQRKDSFDKIRDSVNLNASIDDLSKKIESLEETISNLNDAKSKEELLKALYSLREKFIIIKNLGIEHNKNIVETDEFITEELLEEAKRNYNKRRDFDYIVH